MLSDDPPQVCDAWRVVWWTHAWREEHYLPHQLLADVPVGQVVRYPPPKRRRGVPKSARTPEIERFRTLLAEGALDPVFVAVRVGFHRGGTRFSRVRAFSGVRLRQPLHCGGGGCSGGAGCSRGITVSHRRRLLGLLLWVGYKDPWRRFDRRRKAAGSNGITAATPGFALL